MTNWPLGASQTLGITLPEASRSTSLWFAAQLVTPFVQFDESERDVTAQAAHLNDRHVPSVPASSAHSSVVCVKPTGQRQLREALPCPSTWRASPMASPETSSPMTEQGMQLSSIVSRNSFAAQRIAPGSRMTQSWASFAPATAARASNMIILRGCPGRDAAALTVASTVALAAFRFDGEQRVSQQIRCLRRRAHRRRALAGAGRSENARGFRSRAWDGEASRRPSRLPVDDRGTIYWRDTGAAGV